jgi:hypothetical protein
VPDPVLQYTDPIRAIAEGILTERRRQDVAAPWLTNEIIRRYERQVSAPLDENLLRYAANGGVGGLARRLLKRDIAVPGFPEKVAERLRVGRVYRPTLVLTPDEIRQNVRSKRRAIAYDVRRVTPLERLADLVEAAGCKTVGDWTPGATK